MSTIELNQYVNSLSEVIKEINTKTERYILDQLEDLINTGLLVIEKSTPVLTRDISSDKLFINESVKLVLRDQDIINELKKENLELKTKLEYLHNLFLDDKKNDDTRPTDKHKETQNEFR